MLSPRSRLLRRFRSSLRCRCSDGLQVPGQKGHPELSGPVPGLDVFAAGAEGGAAPPHPASSIRSIGSIGTSIGSHHQRRGSHVAEYDPEVGAIKFNVSESVKSLKLIIDSEVDQDQDSTEHATNIDEPNKQKKKNFLVRFEEATYKQNLEKQCFDESKTTEEIWANAATYDSDVEQLFTYVQVFTASLSSFAHGAVSKKLSFCCFLFIFHQLDVHKLTHTHYVPYRMILPTLSLP